MSFSFFKALRPKTPQEVVKTIKDSLMALDTKTVVEVKALEKALEEVEKNFVTLRCMLCGDGEVEPNMDQVSQLALEVCKEDVPALMIQKLPNLGWEARKDLVHCWSILLKQKVDSRYCSVEYIENHFEFLDFLVVCYDNKEIALNCGLMLRECIKFPTLANKRFEFSLTAQNVNGSCECFPGKEENNNSLSLSSCDQGLSVSILTITQSLKWLLQYILESASFELFFKFVESPNFDVASDAFSTFKDLLTKHCTVVAEYLTAHYDECLLANLKALLSQFFDLYEKLLTSSNYVTRRQSLKLLSEFLLEPPSSHIMKRYILEVRYLKVMMTLLKDSSKNIQIAAFDIFKVFVANPSKPREVKMILAKNHEKLLELLLNLSAGKGAEDEEFEDEKELIIKEIDRLSRLSNHHP
ncbi:hypothetical protein NC653_021929 [Populus alba x Populus x berolinensis]|uniref:Mo25 family protein n=1 Tax=Populus alba x Populus x berolinensis TaxID=444605 RepID=A0AAD6QF25_9ROSI|nr:hypothetical protein NC653_021929 [Populus alba x Populus x berolinensis]